MACAENAPKHATVPERRDDPGGATDLDAGAAGTLVTARHSATGRVPTGASPMRTPSRPMMAGLLAGAHRRARRRPVARERRASRSQQQAPAFEVDPLWPKPLPNHWMLGSAIGVGVDSRDHVFIIHRGSATLNARTEAGLEAHAADRRVLRRRAARARVRPRRQPRELVGRPRRGLHVAVVQPRHLASTQEDNVWIGGNGAERLAHPQVHARRQVPHADRRAGARRRQQVSMDAFGRVAKISFDNAANEAYVADGYGNKRVAVLDMNTGAIKRYWGAYGNVPTTRNLGPYDPDAPLAQQFRNPVHCAEPSQRRPRVRLRPPERSHPGVPQGRHVREGSAASRPQHARRRLDLGHRLLARPGAEVHLPRRRQERCACTSWTGSRSRS